MIRVPGLKKQGVCDALSTYVASQRSSSVRYIPENQLKPDFSQYPGM